MVINYQQNGKQQQCLAPCSISELINQYAGDVPCAVELNGRIINRQQWKTLTINEGDCLEIITAVGGG